MEMMPIVNGLQEEFEGRVSTHQLDASEAANAKLQSDLGLRGHPSFAVLDADSQVSERFFGPLTEVVLRQAMEAVASQ